jgi:hypothetical protein
VRDGVEDKTLNYRLEEMNIEENKMTKKDDVRILDGVVL